MIINKLRRTLSLGVLAGLGSAPCVWAYSGQANASIDAFLTTNFELTSSVTDFRFSELAPAAVANTSTHILIDGLVPVEDGSDVVVSNYRGVDLSSGAEFDVGRVYLTLPSQTTSGATSPIVGIVARTAPASGMSGWSQFSNTPAASTTVGGSSGSVSYDNQAGTLSLSLAQGGSTITGAAMFSSVEEGGSILVDISGDGAGGPITLSDGTNAYTFDPTTLVYNPFESEFYGVLMSADASPAFNSLMFSMSIAGTDADSDNLPDLVDPDVQTSGPVLPGSRGAMEWLYRRAHGTVSEEQTIADLYAAYNSGGGDWAGVLTEIISDRGLDMSYEEQVIRLYIAFLDRPPLSGGLAFNVSELIRLDGDIIALAETFVNSAEFEAKFGGKTNREFVQLVFNSTLGRDPAPAGWDSWEAELNGGLSRAQLMWAFAKANEFGDYRRPELLMGRSVGLLGSTVHTYYQAAYDALILDRGSFDEAAYISGAAALVDWNQLLDDQQPADRSAWVQATYQTLMGATLSAGELATALAALNNNETSEAEWVTGIVESEDFQFGLAPVFRMFQAYFLRNPAKGGLETLEGGFINQANANSLEFAQSSLSQQFVVSAEFTTLYGSLDDSAFVSLVYDNVLRRTVAPGGLAFWTGQLAAGLSRADMMVRFTEGAESAEYKQLVADEMFVFFVGMYLGGNVAQPTTPGVVSNAWISGWVDYLGTGGSREYFVQETLLDTDWATE